MSLHSEFISLIAHMLYHRMLAKVFEVSTEQLLEFVELYLSGTVGVDCGEKIVQGVDRFAVERPARLHRDLRSATDGRESFRLSL